MKYRNEKDSMGDVLVPIDCLWGAQTQRSHKNFPIGIGQETMPIQIIEAFSYLKKAAAEANSELNQKMTNEKKVAIETVCDEIIAGKLNDNFPLVVWQTGSGTQTNMNVNEVIANRANQISKKELLHPNDDCNMSQSSNDTFPTALYIAAFTEINKKLIPAMDNMIKTLKTKEKEFDGIVKCGRTHLMDAVPLLFSQEISGWRTSIEIDKQLILSSANFLRFLALGGTAVGTGLNAPKGFDKLVAQKIAKLTGYPFETAPNKFHALSSKSEIVAAHGAIKALAADLMKIANDVRWLASGPRLGLGEISIPANEPGSSIMPGKVNPTQAEALTMVSVQVMGNDSTIGIAASQGNFELNVFIPVIAYNFLQSVRLLSQSINSFTERCLIGLKANKAKMKSNLDNSLMLVTALNPYVGYEKAAEISNLAFKEGITLKEACLKLGYLSASEFDKIIDDIKNV